ncbi:methyl-accepting chemotaxis protein [Shewanella sp. CG12_big_fil_rev_8_21_14_0_65_47_15]|uniref:methyl-accepting chemotaxis protein n=1 Tax=Shewanella sp. CG12_big_fil_rev_8_21_14_0_65_47_15 TaxID=1975537 RepID=UPI000CAF2BEA|nr:methyl-accepting chemotaxis protein [Shewanella sp. CG12_big_fil_rev_8_21_14_0_65_47_15]PIW59254.1 MAG: methyl-accepting chemotaxis protein [Shewanella sp. CG12_big_fil_rev_8_21_14_0_65_47_15]
MNVIDRLSLSGKFSLLALMCVLLSAIPSVLYITKVVEHSRQATQEAKGIKPVQQLLQLVQLLQQHRDLSSAVLGGNETLQSNRLNKQTEVELALKQFGQDLRDASANADIMQVVQQLQQQWHSLASQVSRADITGLRSLTEYVQLLAVSFQLQDTLLDYFELSLDPVFETYYLIQAALVELPQTTELLSQLRATGALYLTQGQWSVEQGTAMQTRVKEVMQSFELLSRASEKVIATDKDLQVMLQLPLATLRQHVERTTTLTDNQLLTAAGLTYPVSDYIADYTQTIDALFAYSALSVAALDNALTARRDQDWQDIILISVGLLALLSFGAVLASLIVRRILKQFSIAVSAAEHIAKGDLTHDIVTIGMDDGARLLRALQQMQQQLRDTVQHIIFSAGQLALTSEEMAGLAHLSNLEQQQQSDELTLAATAVTQLTTAFEDVAGNAAVASEVSQSAELQAKQGQSSVRHTIGAIEGLRCDISSTATALTLLVDEVGAIGSVLDVIRGIAEQTNLLALNAAIEAARAGDSGRGFAVVADEVRSLAISTQRSTKDIEHIIASVQQGSQQAVQAMQLSNTKAQHTMDMAQQTGLALQQITDAIGQISQRNISIASATEQQSVVAREVDTSLLNIQHSAAQISGNSHQTTDTSKQVSALAAELRVKINHFSV